jgi:hypothetical protein
MIKIYDIELYKNFFCINFIGLDKVKHSFVLYENRNEQGDVVDYINQIPQLLEFLKDVTGLVGFNCLKFDSQVLNYIQKNPTATIQQIYNAGQKTFEDKFYPEKSLIPNLDLFKIHHYDNKNKSTSLKWVEFSMNMLNIQSLPIEPNSEIKPEEVDKLVEYCYNDCEATLDFYWLTKGQTEHPVYKGVDAIQFRKDIQSNYGISCLNYNDVQIGIEIGLKQYVQISKRRKEYVEKLRTFRKEINISDCIENNINFQSETFQLFLKHLKTLKIKPQSIKEEEGFSLNYKGVLFTFGWGGLHTEDKPRQTFKTDNTQIIDCDVISYYPSAIINRGLYPAHLGKEFVEGYKQIFQQRVEAKKLSKTDKSYQSVNEALKLSLNGTYGKTNSEYSYLYDPLVTFKVTVNNQLCLLMLCEKLLDNNINLLSVNTDGLVCQIDNNQEELYYSICKEWEESTKFQLEYAFYNKLLQTSVNDYIAEKTNGELKFKGDFEYDKHLHKNNSARIVPLALKEYFINSVNYIEFIRNHKNIFDFCIGVKAKDYLDIRLYFYEDGKVQYTQIKEKVVRYYVSKYYTTIKKVYNKDVPIKKGLIKKGKVLNLEKGYNLTYFNKFEKKDNYNINYEYYIERVRKIVNQIEQDSKANQLTLF